MKYILYIYFLLPIICSGQWVGSPGEYVNLLLNTSTHRAYTVDNAVPTIVSSPTNVVSITGGPHSACLIDNSGNVWCKGQNPNGVIPNGTQTDQASFVMCMTDNLGGTLDPVVQVYLSGNANKGAFWNVFAVTSTGKLYGAGELESYVIGDGTAGTAVNTRWVQISVGGELVTKIQGGYGMLAKTSLGHVYTWGADRDGFINGQGTTTAATTPTLISLGVGRTATDIAGNGLINEILLDNGTVLGTGQQNLNDYIAIYPTAMTHSFQDITSALSLPASPKSLAINSSTTYAILTTGALWAWGDNSCGTIGNGDMLDWGAYKCCPGPSSGSAAPYNYDNGFHEHMQISPVEPVPGKRDWMAINTCPSNSWFAHGNDSTGRLYTWGRNKFGPLVNRIIGANPVNGGIGAQYPDSWEIPWVTQVFPNPALSYIESTSPYCLLNPSGAPCNTYTPPTNVKPTASLTARQYGANAIILDASGSSDDVYIVSYLHTQLTGTALQLKIRTGQIDTVTNVSVGTYSFKVKVTDNGFLSDSTTVSINVLPPNVIQYSPGQRILAH